VVLTKATEYHSPLTDEIDCKITKHNITLFKLFPIVTSVCVASNYQQDLDFNPVVVLTNLSKAVRILFLISNIPGFPHNN
jgi:hypothetical protein